MYPRLYGLMYIYTNSSTWLFFILIISTVIWYLISYKIIITYIYLTNRWYTNRYYHTIYQSGCGSNGNECVTSMHHRALKLEPYHQRPFSVVPRTNILEIMNIVYILYIHVNSRIDCIFTWYGNEFKRRKAEFKALSLIVSWSSRIGRINVDISYILCIRNHRYILYIISYTT